MCGSLQGETVQHFLGVHTCIHYEWSIASKTYINIMYIYWDSFLGNIISQILAKVLEKYKDFKIIMQFSQNHWQSV